MASTLFDAALVATSEQAVGFITIILRPSTEHSIVGQGLDVTLPLRNEGARQIYAYKHTELVNKAKAPTLHTPEDVEARRRCQYLEAAACEGRWRGGVRTHAETTTAPATASSTAPRDGNAEGFASWR
jgi:hypothetical protein